MSRSRKAKSKGCPPVSPTDLLPPAPSATAVAPSTPPAENARLQLWAAAGQAQAGDFETARELMRQALRFDSNHALNLIDRAWAHWQSGEWIQLIELAQEGFEHTVERAQLALLASVACLQVGLIDQGRTLLQQALDWGVSRELMARLLVSSVHNTLALAQSCVGRDQAALNHFVSSIQTGRPPIASKAIVRMRIHEQRIKIGLPPIRQALLDDRQNPRVYSVHYPAPLSQEQRPAQLIVLGMHRSGTSCLTGLISAMGAYFGDSDVAMQANEFNPKGYWERLDVYKITESILNEAGASWRQLADFDPAQLPTESLERHRAAFHSLVSELDQNSAWIIKDPRFCVLFPIFRDLLENPIILHIYRHPTEVAMSLARRDHMPLSLGLALWEYHNICAFRASRGLPRLLISFGDLQQQPVLTAERIFERLTRDHSVPLAELSDTDISNWVAPDLYHNQSIPMKHDLWLTHSQQRLLDAMETGAILSDRYPLFGPSELCMDTIRHSGKH